MSKKKRGNYNQDYFKVGGSPQPGDDIVQERQKRRLAEQKPEQPQPARDDEPAIPEDEG
jgi:hypothetical protein